MSANAQSVGHYEARERALLAGRVDVLYTLSHHYLFLPFAALCMAANLLEPNAILSVVATPFVMLTAATAISSRLKLAYERRNPESDPRLWAQRFTIVSAVSGAVWGMGAIIWFVPGSFPAQAYVILAFLGMSATEFIGRAAYRQSYLAHAAASLGPLAAMLIFEGGLYPMLSAVLIIFFAGVLYSYSNSVARLLEESILLRYDNSELIGRLSQEKRAAETIRDAAQASERSKTTFISNISHELRTPLNSILGMAQLLERSDLEKAQRDHVKVLLEAGRGLKTLLDDVIALASDADKPLVAPDEGCDAGQAARTVARLMQPNAWEKRLRLSINVAPGLKRVAADARQVRRVLLKLVGNAIKFTERGNVEIALDSTTDAQGRDMVRLQVTDTGAGIPGHLLDSIFQPFTKIDEAHSMRYAGAGVGLAVAKCLVEALGGTIGVESEPGMGASFWVTLPTVSTTDEPETDEETQVAAPEGLNLLAYLPDPAMKNMIERLLVPFGNRVTFAATLAQAATMSARGGFAAILSGAAHADSLAATPGQRTPILALVTAEETPPDVADGVMRWPAPPYALYAALLAAIGTPETKRIESKSEAKVDAAIDTKQIAELEKSLGFKTLIDIMQSFLTTAEEMSAALAAASEREDWTQAGRLAQDFAGTSGELGLTALAAAARVLVQGARDGSNGIALGNAAGDVIAEHQRVREALRRLYPDLSA